MLHIGKFRIGIHKAKYRHSQWYYYLIPRRLTLKNSPAIYKWCFWVYSFNLNKDGIK